MENVFKNAEGYKDLTAGLAIRNAEKIKSGSDVELYSIVKLKHKKKGQCVLMNKHSNYYTMMFVFEEKTESSCGSFDVDEKKYWYDSGRLNYVYFDDVGAVIGKLASKEVDVVKQELIRGLGLERTEATTSLAQLIPDIGIDDNKQATEVVDVSVYVDSDIRIAKLEAERDAYKELCMEMMMRNSA